jgi:hypothetical protein
MGLSYKRPTRRTKAVTVRISTELLARLMRARKAATQSDLINTLLEEEAERLRAEAAIRDSERAAAPGELDDRLL